MLQHYWRCVLRDQCWIPFTTDDSTYESPHTTPDTAISGNILDDETYSAYCFITGLVNQQYEQLRNNSDDRQQFYSRR